MKEDEEKVAQYLTKHNLTVNRFSEKETRNKKTPDFQVLRFVNHDKMCDFWDLFGILTGNLMTESWQYVAKYL